MTPRGTTGRARVAAAAAMIAAMITTAVDASAQNAGPQAPPGARMIEMEEFRQLFVGNTATFVLPDGAAWGREYYDPNGFSVTFLHETGECLDGTWEKRGDYYCFNYPLGASCWLTYEVDGRIEVQEQSGQIQHITEIAQGDPISCLPELFSSVEPDAHLEVID